MGVSRTPDFPITITLPLSRINLPDRSTEPMMRHRINRLVLPHRNRRIKCNRGIRPPGSLGPHRTGHKPAPAIRANIIQNIIHARRAKRALITANPRIIRIRRQVLRAVFTNRPQLKHGNHLAPSKNPVPCQSRMPDADQFEPAIDTSISIHQLLRQARPLTPMRSFAFPSLEGGAGVGA